LARGEPYASTSLGNLRRLILGHTSAKEMRLSAVNYPLGKKLAVSVVEENPELKPAQPLYDVIGPAW
jgi:hypothetical protein